MRGLAEKRGLGYITRGEDWTGMPRHAKAGNVNNALMVTDGEFILILDADQIPEPDILEKTIGYFRDPKLALVQTPQHFCNVPATTRWAATRPFSTAPSSRARTAGTPHSSAAPTPSSAARR